MTITNDTLALELEDSEFNAIDQIILTTYFVLVALVGVPGNISVLFAILSQRSNRNIPSSIYFVGLSISDLFMSTVSGIYNVATISNHGLLPSGIDQIVFCKFVVFIQYFLAFVGILSVSGVSMDRYQSIVHPFWYEEHVTKSKVYRVNIYLWIQAFTSTLPALVVKNYISYDGQVGATCGFQWDKASFIYVIFVVLGNFLIPVVIIVFTNCKVFSVARSQQQRIMCNVLGTLDQVKDSDFDTTHKQRSNSPISRVSEPCSSDNSKQMTERWTVKRRLSTLWHRKRLEWKITFSTLALVVSCFVAWTPFAAVRLVAILFDEHISWRCMAYTGSFTFISSAWNPLFVLATRTDFRKALRTVYLRKRIDSTYS